MIENIHYKNLTRAQKQILTDKLILLAKQLPGEVELQAFFQCSTKGLYKGSIQAHSEKRDGFSMFEDRNLSKVYTFLCNEIRSQMGNAKNSLSFSQETRHHHLPQVPNDRRKKPLFDEIPATEFLKRRPAKILIVEDDIDSLALIDSIFRKLGCETMYSTDSNDAQRQLNGGKADIIILDWMLDNSTGGDIIARCLKNAERYALSPAELIVKKSKIITFSGQSQSSISIPESPLFEHIDHWGKPLRYNELTQRASNLLTELGL